MIYYTGDKHGQTDEIRHFAYKYNLTRDDTIVILGDAGYNFAGQASNDSAKKSIIAKMDCMIFCIHGNHEMRPHHIPSYKTKLWNGGSVYYEEEYPNLLFAIDGEIYDLDGYKTIVIGGAYSIDKFWRLLNFVPWFSDEQPDDTIKAKVVSILESMDWTIDQVLTHTCPIKYEPVEVFNPEVDQARVDKTTEKWLDMIESKLDYKCWKCGHFHTDKVIDKLRFMYHDFCVNPEKSCLNE